MTAHPRLRTTILILAVATTALGAVALQHTGVAGESQIALNASARQPIVTTEGATGDVPADEVGPASTTSTTAPRPVDGAPTTSTTVIATPLVRTDEVHYRKPTATLTTARGTVVGTTSSSSCWKTSPTMSLCACGEGWADPDTSIDVTQGERVSVSYDREDSPRQGNWAVADSYDGESQSSGAIDVNAIAVTMPTKPGTYWLTVSTWWPEGDVHHIFKVNIIGTHAASAPGTILGRTGGDPARTTLRLTGSDGHTTEVRPDGANRFRLDRLRAGSYTLEATIESYPADAAPGQPQVGTAMRTEPRRVTLKAGEVVREDFTSEA